MPPHQSILTLYRTHRGELVKYASAIAGSRAQAEDVVQEAWFRLNRATDLDLVREPLAYLYRLVRNLAIDARRTLTRETARVATEDAAAILASDQPSPEQSAVAMDELRVVLEALAALPERTRIAVRLNRIEGLKLQQVADRLGLCVTRAHALIVEGVAHCDRRRARVAKRQT